MHCHFPKLYFESMKTNNELHNQAQYQNRLQIKDQDCDMYFATIHNTIVNTQQIQFYVIFTSKL